MKQLSNIMENLQSSIKVRFMSEASVFVQATDGNHYRDPVLYGHSWYARFSDVTPEVVVKKHKSTTATAARRRAVKNLDEHEIRAKFWKGDSYTQETVLFPPRWDKLAEAYLFQFDLLAPIPVPLEHKGYIKPPFPYNCTHYTWEMPFETSEIAAAFLTDEKVTERLAQYLLEPNYASFMDQRMIDAKVAEKLLSILGAEFGAVATRPDRSVEMFYQIFGPEITVKKPKHGGENI